MVTIYTMTYNGQTICTNNEASSYTVNCLPGYRVVVAENGQQLQLTIPGGFTEIVGDLDPQIEQFPNQGDPQAGIEYIYWDTSGSCAGY